MASSSATSTAGQPLQFLPLSSSISPSFWHALTDLKLHKLKLSDEPVPITAQYSKGRSVKDRMTDEVVGISGGVELDAGSFEDEQGQQSTSNTASIDRVPLHGVLRNFNTIEEFKSCDKAALLDAYGSQIWEQASSADPLASLQSLNPFLLITFADLKKYRYYYWCGFPAVAWRPGWQVEGSWSDAAMPNAEDKGEPIYLTRPSASATGELECGPIAEFASFWANTPAEEPTEPGAEEGKRPATVGWEKNEKGRLGPRMADLGPLMDPTRLADQAVDLNLQLMRWRILPSLDLDKVKHTKCLLLGAGTLGCYVARTLAWGVRKITLVDSSTVSFSNPVRQPLFEFEDSLNGGKPKAQAAAAALKRVYPGVDATGISLSIPMPGHPVPPASVDAVKKDVEQIEQLIDEHDVVYLLMDSRESRWLPTVIGAAKGKLVMNVALGFDTYLVMRHGLPLPDGNTAVTPGQPYTGQLGCYYCNDVVAPMDSLTDRTLDQMCTVTRPGIASIASSTAVELMVSVLQHPKGPLAPSDIPSREASAPASKTSGDDEAGSSPLGIVPHQIRGFLAQFDNLKITGQAYEKCTGCSAAIREAYEKDAFDLVLKAGENAKYLERLTGLDKLEEETERMMAEGVDWEEDDEGEDDF
ncbi:Autophagy protein 7 [Rhodosporidiobolus nylandii]